MGWNYARYVDKVAEAGKAAYPIPMFVNAWLNSPSDKGPGDYPSGGPQAHMHDIWRAGAPHLDMLTPDIYMPNFPELAARYSRSGNTLFIPECAGDIHGAANAFYAIGQFNAVGYSSMGIGELQRLTAFRAGDAPPGRSPRCREPSPPHRLRHAYESRPADPGSPGQGHHRRRVGQQG